MEELDRASVDGIRPCRVRAEPSERATNKRHQSRYSFETKPARMRPAEGMFLIMRARSESLEALEVPLCEGNLSRFYYLIFFFLFFFLTQKAS